jgi:hypothetical protein
LDADIEAGFCGDFKGAAGGAGAGDILAIELDGALAVDDFHSFGLAGAEVELAGINQAESLFCAAGQKDGVADDAAFEVDIRLGNCGYILEFILNHDKILIFQARAIKVKNVEVRVFAVILICCVVSVCGAQDAGPAVRDLNGTLRHPLDCGKQAGSVLIFYWHDCPICNSYAPEINRICARYTNFNFYIIQVDADLTEEGAKTHAREYGLRAPVVLDRLHMLARLAGATVTPEAVVYGKGERVLYRGRIDNLYADLVRRRAEATERDLCDALDAIAEGKAVGKQPAAIGCLIP